MIDHTDTASDTRSMSANAAAPAGPVHRPVSGANGSLLTTILVCLCIVLPWISVHDHPLYPPDEGRYAATSRNMLDSGNWLVPTLYGEPHVTKPPLVYWLQAAGLRALGPTELAVRWPGLVAASLIMLLTLWFGRSVQDYERSRQTDPSSARDGPSAGLMAMAILAVMPVFVVVARLAITDAVLGLFWFAALVFGYRSVTRHWSYSVLAWFCMALGLLTKGPLAISPLVVLIVWAALSGRTRQVLKALQPWFGLPLACVPIAWWVFEVLAQYPEAREIWMHETVDRATGAGEHVAPFLYYLPVFLVGAFPATAIMAWPWLNYSWRDLWTSLKDGTAHSLLILSVLIPLIGLSFISGKLPTYVFPLAPSAALLSAGLLIRWIQRRGEGESGRRHKVPSLIPGLTVICIGIAFGAIGFAVFVQFIKADRVDHTVPPLALTLPLLLLPVVTLWASSRWKRPAWQARRSTILLVLWSALVACVLWTYFIENTVRQQTDGSQLADMVQQIGQELGPDTQVYCFGYRDPTLMFYLDRTIDSLEGVQALVDAADRSADQGPILVLADSRLWDKAVERFPDLPGRYRNLDTARSWPTRRILIMTPESR